MSIRSVRILLIHFYTILLLLMGVRPCVAQGHFYYSSGIQEPEWLFEGGISWGTMNGVTDIMGNPRIYQGPFAGITVRKSQATAGLYGTATWKDLIGLRLEANYGRIEGFDSLIKNPTAPSAIGRYDRNLNFRSPIREIAIGVEFHPRELFFSLEREPPRLSPYLLAGFAWFSFYPQGYTAAGWVDLPPLRLEGEGFAEYPDRHVYKLYSWAYPMGIGFRYDASPKLTIRLEFNKRTTFTDYIDDAHEASWVNPALFDKYLSPSQAALAKQLYNRSVKFNPPRDTRPRAHPSENDAYWSAVIKFGFNFNRGSSNSGIFGGATRKDMMKRLKCPNF